LTTKTLRALSASSIGMPKIGLDLSLRAAGFTTSLAPMTRDQLVEALIDPSARIAPGYGLATLTMSDGRQVAGTAMPPLGQVLDPKDVRDLVAYLASLR
jgi:hypothetical protein